MSEPGVDPWLVLRTRSRHENVVEQVLQQKQIAAYLPKRQVMRCWQGRKRAVEMPLFPGYLFVRPRADQYDGMRYIRGSCGLVLAADSKPARLPDHELRAVQMLADSDAAITVDTALLAGTRVRIISGPLVGVEGELVQVKNQDLLAINVNLIGSSVRVHISRDAIAVL